MHINLQPYVAGEYMPLLKSGKFPTFTESDLKLVLDRYLLTKVGSFPDCYERLATNFFNTKNEVSALVTCERAVSIFYGWGHPVNFHAKLMSKIPGNYRVFSFFFFLCFSFLFLCQAAYILDSVTDMMCCQ